MKVQVKLLGGDEVTHTYERVNQISVKLYSLVLTYGHADQYATVDLRKNGVNIVRATPGG